MKLAAIRNKLHGAVNLTENLNICPNFEHVAMKYTDNTGQEQEISGNTKKKDTSASVV